MVIETYDVTESWRTREKVDIKVLHSVLRKVLTRSPSSSHLLSCHQFIVLPRWTLVPQWWTMSAPCNAFRSRRDFLLWVKSNKCSCRLGVVFTEMCFHFHPKHDLTHWNTVCSTQTYPLFYLFLFCPQWCTQSTAYLPWSWELLLPTGTVAAVS